MLKPYKNSFNSVLFIWWTPMAVSMSLFLANLQGRFSDIDTFIRMIVVGSVLCVLAYLGSLSPWSKRRYELKKAHQWHEKNNYHCNLKYIGFEGNFRSLLSSVLKMTAFPYSVAVFFAILQYLLESLGSTQKIATTAQVFEVFDLFQDGFWNPAIYPIFTVLIILWYVSASLDYGLRQFEEEILIMRWKDYQEQSKPKISGDVDTK
tara:strand:- start:18 stop:635 length:618 start_codon:yes stop_codon:yes gene_type:complete